MRTRDLTSSSHTDIRMGALDVCPFIPVRNVTVAECVAVAEKFGALLAEELQVPVFLYGEASQRDYRKTMPQIRAGEYEGLQEKVITNLKYFHEIFPAAERRPLGS